MHFFILLISLFYNYSHGLELGDSCLAHTNEQGTCTRLGGCDELRIIALQQLRPTKCNMSKSKLLICCPKSKTLEKCKEYNEKYYKNFKDPTTQIDPRRLKLMKQKRDTAAATVEVEVEEQSDPVDIILGGNDALSKEYPHMAALGYGDETDPKWLCGGSLISEQFVLTAAHCLVSREHGVVNVVRLGELNLLSEDDIAAPQDYKVKRLIRHPDYKPPSKYDDIALIELENPVTITPFVKPACIERNATIEDNFGWATGWGHLEYLGESATHLQTVLLEIFKPEHCSMFYKTGDKGLERGFLDYTQLCAGGEEHDTCQGDSGGPLQYRRTAGDLFHTIIGVTSFGKPCGLSKAPGVYTKVSHYIAWIESIVWPIQKTAA